MAIREVIQGVEYDGLLGGPEFPTLTKNVTVLSGTTLKRGAVVSKNSDGKYVAVTTAVIIILLLLVIFLFRKNSFRF